jgi:hypothetical protein
MNNAPKLIDELFCQRFKDHNQPIYKLVAEYKEGEVFEGRQAHCVEFTYPRINAQTSGLIEWHNCYISEIPDEVQLEWLKFLAQESYSIFSFGLSTKGVWLLEQWEAATNKIQYKEMELEVFAGNTEFEALYSEFYFEDWESIARKNIPEMEIVFQGVYPIQPSQIELVRRAYQIGQAQQHKVI